MMSTAAEKVNQSERRIWLRLSHRCLVHAIRPHGARGGGRRWLLFWLLVGPGILAMLGENDGPSMVFYRS